MLQALVLDDFRGGVNAQDEAHALAPNELRFLQDAIFDAKGGLRRRGGYGDRIVGGLPTYIPGRVLGATRHAYANEQAVLIVAVDEDGTKLWFLPHDGTRDHVFTLHEEQASTAVFAPTYTGRVTEANQDLNNRPDATIISTDKAVYTFTYDPDEATDVDRSNLVLIAKKGVDHAHDPAAPESGGYRLPGAGYRCAATVNGYTFLANQVGDPTEMEGTSTRKSVNWRQHLWWSRLENGSEWKHGEIDITYDADTGLSSLDLGGWEHVPQYNGSRIVSLRALNGTLVIIKEEGILSVKIQGDPENDWDKVERATAGALDDRSVQVWRNHIVFPNRDGLWLYDSLDIINISDEVCGHEWRTVMAEWDQDWTVAAAVYGSYYHLVVKDGSGAIVMSHMWHLPSRRFCYTSNISIHASSPSEDGLTTYGYRSGGVVGGVLSDRIVDLGAMHSNGIVDRQSDDSTPLGQVKHLDVVGHGPQFAMTTGAIAPGGTIQGCGFRQLGVSAYLPTQVGSPELNIRVRTGVPEYSDPAVEDDYEAEQWTTVLPRFAAQPGRRVQRRVLSKHGHAITVSLNEENTYDGDNSFADVAVDAIRVMYKPMRMGRP